MYIEALTESINATINRQLLEHQGVPLTDAMLIAAAITALDPRYRLEPIDGPHAYRFWREGFSFAAIASMMRAP